MSEGIFLYTMTYLYNFDYLNDDVIQNKLSPNSTLTLWESNMIGYCSEVSKILDETVTKMSEDEQNYGKYWIRTRLAFLKDQVPNYEV